MFLTKYRLDQIEEAIGRSGTTWLYDNERKEIELNQKIIEHLEKMDLEFIKHSVFLGRNQGNKKMQKQWKMIQKLQQVLSKK